MGDDAALIDRFLEMMAAERGASRNTLLAYRADLEGAGHVLGGLSGASKDMIAGLADAWAELAASSVARKASALRAFYGFLEEEGLRADNPSSSLPRPATRRPLPKILSVQEVDALFALIEQKLIVEHPAPLDLRLSALIELLYGSGLRATELVSLPRRALAADRPFLILKGKGARERLVPISDRARAAVAAWLPHVPAESAWLFPSGKNHVSRIRLYQLVKQLAAAAGIAPQRVSPHVLRHASPRTCWKAARICARFSPCWVMPILGRRKFTPMSTAVASSNSSTADIHWRRCAIVSLTTRHLRPNAVAHG